jgi:beta-galactosidase
LCHSTCAHYPSPNEQRSTTIAKKAAPKHVDRREFLKLAGAAVGAAALLVAMAELFDLSGVAQAQITDISNGLRGQNFNSGWKFNRGDVSGAQSTSFNDSAWRGLSVPHDWSIELAFNQGSPAGSGGGYLDGGVGWYRKSFTLPASASGNRVLIQFDGVYMNSEVWINGNSLGTRPYGYSTFEYDLTPFVTFGGATNVVAVRVNNNQPDSRWYSGSGIYRNVWLTTVSPVRVAFCGVFVSTPTVSSNSAGVSVSTQVQSQSSATQSVTVVTTILNAGGTSVASNTTAASNIAANGQTTFSQSLNVANPQLWSVASPNLYQVRTQVVIGGNVVDTYLSPLGIRSFQSTPTPASRSMARA